MALANLIVKADLVARISAAEVDRFSKSNDPFVDQCIATATDRFRDEARRVFTVESIDALTSSSAPLIVKYHIGSDALDILSSGSKRPDHIEAAATEASQWRKFLAMGKVSLDGLVKIGSGTGTMSFAGQGASRVFGRTSDGMSDFDLHDPKFR